MFDPSTQNINDNFFEGIYKEVWRMETPEGLTQAEVDFIEEMGASQKFSVLDIMCGYGRHALELGRRGHNVIAIDNLQNYIDEIQNVSNQQNLPITALQKNVLNYDFNGRFDVAICMGNSFAFFDAQNTQIILKKLYNCLNAGGIFIFNTWMLAETVIKYFEEQTSHAIGNYHYLKTNKYLFHPTRIESDFVITSPSGKTERRTGIDYIFSVSEMEAMLNEAGFKIRDIYSTPRKRKFVFGEKRAYIVAVKQ